MQHVKRNLSYPENFNRQQQPGSKSGESEICSRKRKDILVKDAFINELAAQYKTGDFELIEELWKAGAPEEKLLAVKMLGKIAKKDPERSLKMIQLFAGNIGNWGGM